jgi:hypothetical protein
MHHKFVVSLDEVTFRHLADRAERERRGVREQATLLLERILRASPRRQRRDDDDEQQLPALVGPDPVTAGL